MKLSVFTPSHNLQYIDTPLESLKAQVHKDFEWILLLNGEALSDKDSIENKLNESKLNFKIISDETENNNIGYLKKQCCESSTGEALVELDHDDALTPDCLEELSTAFEQGHDFCFSDDYYVEIKDGKEEYITPFPSETGFTIEQDKNGIPYHPTFEPSALSFSYIWYAPDHVRSWKKSFYDKIGGHDETLDVCDDYDLMCRSYIDGRCHRVPKPLYKYYAYPNRTSADEKNSKIQDLTHVLHDKYIMSIASKWAEENNLKKIDLCCGERTPNGFTGVDKKDFGNGNIVFDLDQANWPFEDGSVGVFRAWNALSYLKNPIQTMKEIYRCLDDYGWVIADVVSTDGRGAFQDPKNASLWNTNSFWYYTKSEFAKAIETPVKFQLNRILNYHPTDFEEFHDIVYAKAHLVKLPQRGFEIPVHGREV